jgi:hypothetical protein
MCHRQILFLKLSLLSFCLALSARPGQAQTTDDSKTIFDLEKQRNYAISLGDEKALSDLLDESYYGVTASGKVINKSEQLTLYKSSNPYVTFTAEDVSVNVFESTATVIGTLVSKTKSGSTIGKTRYLFIYLKKDGKWKIIITQETVVIKE